MKVEAFRLAIADSELADLQQRLARTRFADDFGNDDWRYGTNGSYLRELIAYWRDRYDWRAQERAINTLPQFRAVIDGVPIHFVHVRGKGDKPMPLILNHGWPWTFWDLRKLIGPLSDPAAHGGDPRDAFDVIVPSLPGYGFSTPLTQTGHNFWTTADLWVKLMEGLGYPRFATQGGDWGAFISQQLGHKYADRVIGVHTALPVPLDVMSGGTGVDAADYEGEELAWRQKNAMFWLDGSAYAALQSTRPQTPSYALNDSPAGLCAWILEKRRAWSDCGGDVESVFSKDDLLTTMSIYWFTQSYHSSARYYYEAAHNPWQPAHARMPVVEAPTAATVFVNDVIANPRRWAERYFNLKRWTVHERGGHFAPVETPQLLIEELRSFFRTLR